MHVDEHLLTQNAATGDVVTVDHAGHGHGFPVDGFRRDRDVVHQPGQGAAQHLPAHPDQKQCHRNRQSDVQPGDLEPEGTCHPKQHHHSGPYIAGGVLRIGLEQ